MVSCLVGLASLITPRRQACLLGLTQMERKGRCLEINMVGGSITADEVLAGIDLAGRRALVTGVSSGIGVATVRALVARGAEVVGTARDLAKAADATDSVRDFAANGVAFELMQLDLADFASVRHCADQLTAMGQSFDFVIANAGVMACPFALTADGFEMQLGTNHLGHFLLVNRIATLIRPGGRLVMLSSSGHRGGDVDLGDPNFTVSSYNPWKAYSRSKTANILFALEFDRRHAQRGIRACAIHPGRVDTGLFRHLGEGGLDGIVAMVDKGRAKQGLPPSATRSPEQGAATSVWAAVVASGDEIGGHFCENCSVSPRNDGEQRIGNMVGVRSYAVDPQRAQALWAKSEEWVGETFPAS
jgi:NAD(P)-dependent dehydrogenase (short-subunit alcohol dehydrogenase family)